MKSLKLKVYLSSFFAVILFSLIITSCSSDESVINEVKDELLLEKGKLLPMDAYEKGPNFINDHLSNLSKELEITYANNFVVAQYLKHFGKAETVFNSISKSSNLSEIDLSIFLTADQVNIIKSNLKNSVDNIQLRGCTPVYEWNNCCWRNNWNQCVGCWKHVTNHPIGC